MLVFYQNSEYFKLQFITEAGILPAIIFQIAILAVFAARFVLLFFNRNKIFWFNKGLYLIGLILLAFYWLESRPPENLFKIYSTYSGVFKHASKSFDNFGLWYLTLSPLRFLITLIAAFVKSK